MCIISNPSPLRVIACKDEDTPFTPDEVSSLICQAIRDLGKQKKPKEENYRLVCNALSHADLKKLSDAQTDALKIALFSLNAFKGSDRGLRLLAALMEGGASKELIEELKGCFSQGELNNFRTQNGQTFLHLAVKNNYFDFAKELIENGIDPRVLDKTNESAMMLATNHIDAIVEKFFALFKEKGIQLDQANEIGLTPLERLSFGRPELVAKILGKPPVVVPANMQKIIDLFRKDDGAEILAKLQEKFGIADWNDLDVLDKLNTFRDTQGNSLLYYAMKAPIEVMQKLLSAGMDPNHANILGQTPLAITNYGKVAKAQVLFDKGGDFLKEDITGRNVWAIFLSKGELGAIPSLLEDCQPMQRDNLDFLVDKMRELIKLETKKFQNHSEPDAAAPGYLKIILNCMKILELCGEDPILNSDKTSFAWICFNAHRQYKSASEAMYSADELDQLQKIEDAVLERVLIGHMNKIESNDDFDYEGLYHKDLPKMKTRIYAGIANAPMLDEMSPAEIDNLHEMIRNEKLQKNPEKILNGIRAGEFTALEVGYNKHSCEAVFQGQYLVICNRGMRPLTGFFSRKSVPTIMAFKIDPSKLTEELLKSIMDVKKDKKAFMNLIYKDLPKLLSPTGKKAEKDGNCLAIEANPPKDQVVGNCSLASFKTAILVGFRLNAILNGDKAIPVADRLEKTQKLFKKVWTFTRASLLEEYAKSAYRQLDTDVEKRSLVKLKKHIDKHYINSDVVLAPFGLVREGLRELA